MGPLRGNRERRIRPPTLGRGRADGAYESCTSSPEFGAGPTFGSASRSCVPRAGTTWRCSRSTSRSTARTTTYWTQRCGSIGWAAYERASLTSYWHCRRATPTVEHCGVTAEGHDLYVFGHIREDFRGFKITIASSARPPTFCSTARSRPFRPEWIPRPPRPTFWSIQKTSEQFRAVGYQPASGKVHLFGTSFRTPAV